MATIQDIADIAGVSVATVSRAFHDGSRISAQTRAQILKIADEAGYHPKQYISKKRSLRKSTSIGLVIDHQSYPFSNRVLCGIGDIASAEHVMLLSADSKDDPKQDILCINYLRNIVQGLIIVPSIDATEQNSYNTQFLEEVNHSIPLITMVRNTNLNNVDSIAINNYSPSYNAIQILINHGHKHIAIITGPLNIKPSHDKLSAYSAAIRDHGLTLRSEYICYGEFNEETVCKLTKELLTNHPQITALFTSNTAITRGCLKALDELNLHIPENISLISYGNEFCFSLGALGITSIADPHFSMGQQAARLLLRRIPHYRYNKNRSPERIVLFPELIIRGSEVFPTAPLSTLKWPPDKDLVQGSTDETPGGAPVKRG